MDEQIALSIDIFDFQHFQIIPSNLAWEDLQIMMQVMADTEHVTVAYIDDDNDLIFINSQEELKEAFKVARKYDNTLKIKVGCDEKSVPNKDEDTVDQPQAPVKSHPVEGVSEEAVGIALETGEQVTGNVGDPGCDHVVSKETGEKAPLQPRCVPVVEKTEAKAPSSASKKSSYILWFFLKHECGLVLDVKAWSEAAGTEVILFPQKDRRKERIGNQLWFKHQPTNTIRSKFAPHMCLTIKNSQGAMVILPHDSSKGSNPYQTWAVIEGKISHRRLPGLRLEPRALQPGVELRVVTASGSWSVETVKPITEAMPLEAEEKCWGRSPKGGRPKDIRSKHAKEPVGPCAHPTPKERPTEHRGRDKRPKDATGKHEKGPADPYARLAGVVGRTRPSLLDCLTTEPVNGQCTASVVEPEPLPTATAPPLPPRQLSRPPVPPRRVMAAAASSEAEKTRPASEEDEEKPPAWFTTSLEQVKEELLAGQQQSEGRISTRVLRALEGAVIASVRELHPSSASSPAAAPSTPGAADGAATGPVPAAIPSAQLSFDTPDRPDTYCHKGIICDRCENTIVGVRYKCGNCEDYDMCARCEAVPGVHDESHLLVKIRRPLFTAGRCRDGRLVPLLSANLYSLEKHILKRLENETAAPSRGEATTLPPVARQGHGTSRDPHLERLKRKQEKLRQKEEKIKVKQDKLKRRIEESRESPNKKERLHTTAYAPVSPDTMEAQLLRHVTVPDDTHVTPGQHLPKRWLLRNSGASPWSAPGTCLVYVYGNMQPAHPEVVVPTLAPGEEGVVEALVIAPQQPGVYQSHWRLSFCGLRFGPRLWCSIIVDDVSRDVKMAVEVEGQEELVQRVEALELQEQVDQSVETEEVKDTVSEPTNQNRPYITDSEETANQREGDSNTAVEPETGLLVDLKLDENTGEDQQLEWEEEEVVQLTFKQENTAPKRGEQTSFELLEPKADASPQTATPNNTPLESRDVSPRFSPLPPPCLSSGSSIEHLEHVTDGHLEAPAADDVTELVHERMAGLALTRRQDRGSVSSDSNSSWVSDLGEGSDREVSDSDMSDDFYVVPIPDCFSPGLPPSTEQASTSVCVIRGEGWRRRASTQQDCEEREPLLGAAECANTAVEAATGGGREATESSDSSVEQPREQPEDSQPATDTRAAAPVEGEGDEAEQPEQCPARQEEEEEYELASEGPEDLTSTAASTSWGEENTVSSAEGAETSAKRPLIDEDFVVRRPADFNFANFDDEPVSDRFGPALTTQQQDVAENALTEQEEEVKTTEPLTGPAARFTVSSVSVTTVTGNSCASASSSAHSVVTSAIDYATKVSSSVLSTAKDVFHTLQARNEYVPPRSEWRPQEDTWTLPPAWVPTTPPPLPDMREWTPPPAWVLPTPPPVPDMREARQVPPATTAPPRQPTPMEVLVEMGFANRDVNLRLLERFHNDLDRVIQELLSDSDNNWHATRH